MDKMFHINSNGDVKPCSATKNVCQFGAGVHFASENEARAYVEKSLVKDGGGFSSKKKKPKEPVLKIPTNIRKAVLEAAWDDLDSAFFRGATMRSDPNQILTIKVLGRYVDVEADPKTAVTDDNYDELVAKAEDFMLSNIEGKLNIFS